MSRYGGIFGAHRIIGLLLGGTALICLTMGFWLSMRADYEDEVFRRIAEKALDSGKADGERVLGLLHAAHELVVPRYAVFRSKPYVNVTDSLFRTPLHDLMDGRGACGSYAAVLARLLQVSGYDFRMVQMHCRDARGCHMLLEARTGSGWVALDAMYDLAFRNRDGALVGMADIGPSWEYYRTQTPVGFPTDYYTFREFDYTNWQKVPYLMPAIKGIFWLFIGEEVETLSLRAYVIDRGRLLSRAFLFAAMIALLAAWVVIWRVEKKPRTGVVHG